MELFRAVECAKTCGNCGKNAPEVSFYVRNLFLKRTGEIKNVWSADCKQCSKLRYKPAGIRAKNGAKIRK